MKKVGINFIDIIDGVLQLAQSGYALNLKAKVTPDGPRGEYLFYFQI
jgi:hypothetical protein